jgi:orotidine-5'-phosphate decarboxylase
MSQVLPAHRLIVALDVVTISEAHTLLHQLAPVVSTFKIGYSLLLEPSLHLLIAAIRSEKKQFFLDAKLNDIPRTVKRGVESAARRGADFITVHSNEAMLTAAMAGKGDSPIKIMAVTALTSFTVVSSRDQFRAGLLNAMITGCDGVIMSPYDLTDRMGCGTSIREMASKMIIATPGVRLAGEQINDHGRTGTPTQAIADGADYIIVGRPIIEAKNPLAEAERFIALMTE